MAKARKSKASKQTEQQKQATLMLVGIIAAAVRARNGQHLTNEEVVECLRAGLESDLHTHH